MARTRNRLGCVARRAASDGSGARALLGDRVRLAQDRGETECPSPVRDRDRWTGHSFHPCAFEAQKRIAADCDAWMAGLDHRADEDYRSADEPHRTRWE